MLVNHSTWWSEPDTRLTIPHGGTCLTIPHGGGLWSGIAVVCCSQSTELTYVGPGLYWVA